MSPTIRTYELYRSRGGGRVSNTNYSHGDTIYRVSAQNIRQAYAVVYRGEWVNPDARYPVGVLETYSTDYEGNSVHRLWCGCAVPCAVGHGSGVTKIREAIADHIASCQSLI